MYKLRYSKVRMPIVEKLANLLKARRLGISEVSMTSHPVENKGLGNNFGKKKQGDEELCRQYVRQVFAIGREISPSIAKAVQMSTQGEVPFPVNDNVNLEISLAILGTSLAVLKGHSQIVPAERGTQIEAFCKSSIERDYDLPADSVSKLNEALDKYQDAFQKSMAVKNNPFGETSGMMLVRCLGPRAKALCLPGTSSLNPFVHQVVGDVMTMTVTQAMTFWKGK